MGEISNYSVKMDEEDKQEIQRLINDSGLQAKDFMAGLITSYKINKVKQSSPDAKADIEELQYHTSRVNQIYYNLTSRVDANIKDITQLSHYKLESKQVEIGILKEEIDKLTADIDNSKLMNQSVEQTIQQQANKIKELESSSLTLQALSEEYKQKNDTLNGILNEYKHYKDENILIAKQLQEQKESNRQVNINLSDANKKIESLQQQQQDLKSKHESELKLKEDSLFLECGNRVLKLKQEQLEQLEKVREEYNNKVKELLLKMQESQVKVNEPMNDIKK